MAVFIPLLLVESELAFDNVIDGVAMIMRLKRSCFFNESVYEYTKSPEVNPLIITSSSEHLRSTIIGCSSHGEHFFSSSTFKTFTTASKVNQNCPLIFFIVQYIFGLYVSVANVFFMNVLQSFNHF